MYISDTPVVSTLGKKEVRINLKINPRLREEFQAAAHLRGATMSSLLHQYIVRIVREEKEHSGQEFAKALEWVRSAEASEAEGYVYGEVGHLPNPFTDPEGFEHAVKANEAEKEQKEKEGKKPKPPGPPENQRIPVVKMKFAPEKKKNKG